MDGKEFRQVLAPNVVQVVKVERIVAEGGPAETELFRANNPPGSEGEERYLAKITMRRSARLRVKPAEHVANQLSLSSLASRLDRLRFVLRKMREFCVKCTHFSLKLGLILGSF